MKKIRILIADDQTLMREGLKIILDLEEDMEVVATAENGNQAYQLSGEFNPDIVLMDIRMPEMDGVESTKLIKRDFPDISVIMLTTFNDEEYIIQALSYGAGGYLLKDIPGNKLIEAVRSSANGTLILPAPVAAKLSAKLSQITLEGRLMDKAFPVKLSEREKEIASLIVEGQTNRQIASRLFISEGTVKNYISTIYTKIGINDRTKAALYLKGHLPPL